MTYWDAFGYASTTITCDTALFDITVCAASGSEFALLVTPDKDDKREEPPPMTTATKKKAPTVFHAQAPAKSMDGHKEACACPACGGAVKLKGAKLIGDRVYNTCKRCGCKFSNPAKGEYNDTGYFTVDPALARKLPSVGLFGKLFSWVKHPVSKWIGKHIIARPVAHVAKLAAIGGAVFAVAQYAPDIIKMLG